MLWNRQAHSHLMGEEMGWRGFSNTHEKAEMYLKNIQLLVDLEHLCLGFVPATSLPPCSSLLHLLYSLFPLCWVSFFPHLHLKLICTVSVSQLKCPFCRRWPFPGFLDSLSSLPHFELCLHLSPLLHCKIPEQCCPLRNKMRATYAT